MLPHPLSLSLPPSLPPPLSLPLSSPSPLSPPTPSPQWYGGCVDVHDGQREHLKHTCRHKNLHLPPDTNPRSWDISFPDSLECEQLMHK